MNRSNGRSSRIHELRTGILFAAPWLLGLLSLTVLPAASIGLLSLLEWNGADSVANVSWVGLHNYQLLARDDAFYSSVWNSVVYTAMFVPANIVFALALALLLNDSSRVARWTCNVVFVPYVLGAVAAAMIWAWLLNPQFGMLNTGLRFCFAAGQSLMSAVLPLDARPWTVPDWLYSPAACKPALVLMQLWLCGGTVLVLLASLHRVPVDLQEAAAVDGAGSWERFRHVVLPHIAGPLVFCAVVGVIHAMHEFDAAFLLQNRSQQDRLLFGMLYLYRVAFEPPFQMGRAAAMTWILLLATAVLVCLAYVSMRRLTLGDRAHR